MEKARRDNLRRVVYKCRQILEDEFAKKIRYYGCTSEGQFTDVSKLTHLNGNEIGVRDKLESAVAKEKIGGLSQKAALQRYIEHAGFTYLNRFAALRLLEVRGLVKETVMRRNEYGGRSLRERDIWESDPALPPEELVRKSLLQAFAEVGKEIKVLFDSESEYSLLFPGITACMSVMELLSNQVTQEDWMEDDVIGWVYQYYNDEAREEFRKERRKLRADDVPVVNQFYTPDWIVRALVDNSLGKLWLEAHPTSGLRSYAQSLITSGSQGAKRDPKSVRQLKVLDPACGSGHFLAYAFDLLYQMYREEEPETPESEIPSLIFENNVFGIDIDLRAVQLAALNLFLKAKKYNPSLKIRKMNLVCADVRISNGERRASFIGKFKGDEGLRDLFQRLFDNLSNTFEIGSLLKVRAPFEALFAERKQTGEAKQTVFEMALTGQTEIGERGLVGQSSLPARGPDQSEKSLVVTIPRERTIDEMLEQLRAFEIEASDTQDMGRLLFATEAEKSVGLLSLLSQRYDVVLMNPPYGDMPELTKKYLREYYPKTHFDFYAAFMEQAADLTVPDGYVGALVGRTFMFLRSFQWVREELLGQKMPPTLVLDLGYGVLDVATARWAAFVSKKATVGSRAPTASQEILFVRLIEGRDESQKKPIWESAVTALRAGDQYPLAYKVTLKELAMIPGTPFSYWTSRAFRALFEKYPPLDRDVARRRGQQKIGDVKVGLQTGDDYRFTRMWWEASPESIASSRKETFQGKKWVPFANDAYLFHFYGDVRVLVDWESGGSVYSEAKGAVIRNESFFFRPGLAWSARVNRSQMLKLKQIRRIPFRVLPPGSIFGTTGQSAMIQGEKQWVILALCCSTFMYYLSRLIAPDKMTTSTPASLPIALPPKGTDSSFDKLATSAREAYDLLLEHDTGDELSTLFIKPWILQVLEGCSEEDKPNTRHPFAHSFQWSEWQSAVGLRSIIAKDSPTLRLLSSLCTERERKLQERLNLLLGQIDETVYQLYGVSVTERSMVEKELSSQMGGDEESSQSDETTKEGELSGQIMKEQTARLISYYAKRTIEASPEGIVPIGEEFPQNLLQGVREFLQADFGARWEDIEREFEDIQGVSLSKWLEVEFFDFHVSLYRGRPIYWQLSSGRLGRNLDSPSFTCFVNYHKLTHDTIAKVSVIVKKTKERLNFDSERLRRELNEAKEHFDKAKIDRISRDSDITLARVEEIEKFDQALEKILTPTKSTISDDTPRKWVDEAISEVRDRGWYPNLDYGVLVNITPLKEAQLLHPAASRVR
jgi:SAM-dependent methyltransferase